MSELSKVVVVDSQAPVDIEWTTRLVVQLRVLKGELTVWDELQIAPGDDRVAVIETEAATADLAVLVVSADLLTSDLVEKTVVPALPQGQCGSSRSWCSPVRCRRSPGSRV